MASNHDEVFFHCSHCKRHLNLESKTLTCLHSFCETCVHHELQGQTNGNGRCPQCHEIVKIDQLTLSPILVSCLKRRQMELTVWKCDLCLEDGIESIATNWCKNCERFLCTKCNQFHNKLYRQHNSVKLAEISKEEIRKAMRTDMCKIHYKVEESYCDRCNMCFCDTCYTTHLEHSRHCSSRPMSIREALKKQKSQGPTLLKEIKDLEKNLRERNEISQVYSEVLERQCDFKCEELWHDYEDIVEKLRDKVHQMCDELRQITKEQVKKWRQSVNENKRILKKLDIWRINLRYLLKKEQKQNLVFGVELVARKLASSSPEFHQIINKPLRKLQLQMEFSRYWQEFLQGLQNKIIGSGSLDYSDNSIEFENEWKLPILKSYPLISSILVSPKDNHIFLADNWSCSIIELEESGEFVCELILSQGQNRFDPQEMFFSSSEILGVNCRVQWWEREGQYDDDYISEEKLIFLERKNNSPFLKIKEIINKKKQNSSSVCQVKKKILFCDYLKFQIDFYTAKGEYIKTIDTGESGSIWPLIRADSSTEKFWGAVRNSCKIFCFNENGEKLKSFKTKERISDFSVNEFGEIYFCNFDGIFTFFPEKNLHRFQKKSEKIPKIFISKEKIFVCLEIDDEYLIKIFKFKKLI